jgi:hypothetical protein
MYNLQCFTLITKDVCSNYNFNRGFIPAENRDREEMFTASFCGDFRGNFFRCGDGDGEAFSNREFPIAIPMYQVDICLCIVLTNV